MQGRPRAERRGAGPAASAAAQSLRSEAQVPRWSEGRATGSKSAIAMWMATPAAARRR
jgi:hypothetical protein